jgi:methylphosphotriester-DNA--protein-cysteine methyltransferase
MKKLAVILLMLFILASPAMAKAKKAKPETAAPASGSYVASKTAEPFHLPSCKWVQKISKDNIVYYKTKEDAIKDGHRPCKVCKP